MNFLAPLFLAGLAALAVPVIIHLIHRERKDIVEFPSLMFVRRIPFKATRRQKLRNILLFALRCLALILIAAAFARPLVRKDIRSSSRAAGSRELVLLLDRSYSMSYEGRWDRARAAADSVVRTLVAGDRATLVFFDQNAAAQNRADDRAGLTAALRGAVPGSAGTRYAPALRVAQSVLSASRLPRRELVMISDFQRTGWNDSETPTLPAGTQIGTVDVGGASADNVAIASATSEAKGVGDRERITVTARVTHTGAEPVTRTVALALDGREIQRKPVTLAANGAASVSFDPFISSTRTTATVSATKDALPADDAYNMVIAADRGIAVLLAGTAAPQSSSLYIRQALDAGDVARFQVTSIGPAELRGRDLSRTDVIVLDGQIPGGAAGRRIAEYVANGGGLVVLAGSGASSGDVAEQLMPATVGRVVEQPANRGSALASVDYAHPAFESFGAPGAGVFSAARFYRYRELRLVEGATALARLNDGTIALAEKRHGKGRVLVWGSTLESYWNDLVLQPVFPPFIHELTAYASGRTELPSAHVAGTVLDLSSLMSEQDDESRAGRELLALAPSGARIPIRSGERQALLRLDERGFYRIREPGQRREDAIPVAVNVDVAESDLTHMQPSLLVAALGTGGAANTSIDSDTLTPQEQERRQAFWWYLLVGAFALLAIETWLSNRLSIVARAS